MCCPSGPDDPLPRQVVMFLPLSSICLIIFQRFYPTPRSVMVVPVYDTPITSREVYYSSYPESSSESDRSFSRRGRSRVVYTDSEDDDSRSRPRTRRSSSYDSERAYRPYQRSPRRHEYQRDYDDYDRDSGYLPHDPYSNQEPLRTSNTHLNDPAYPPSFHHGQSNSDDYNDRNSYRPHNSLGHEILGEVQKYLNILPPSPHFRWSNCTGRKKAVCVSDLTA